MDKYVVRKSLLNKTQQKIALFVFEIFIFFVAIIFLMPVFLAFINSFKSNAEVQVNILSLPKFSIEPPKKIEKRYFDGFIINRMKREEDKLFIASLYSYSEAEYILIKKSWKKKLEDYNKQYNTKFSEKISESQFNDFIKNIDSETTKDEIRNMYRFKDGVYLLKKISKEEKKKASLILKDNKIFKSFFENFSYNYGQSWEKTKFHIVFINTLLITVLSAFGIVLVSSMAAYALVRTKTNLSWILFLVFTFAMVVPFQAIMFPLVRTAKALGILGTIHGIVLIYIGVGCPMAIFMYHGFIKNIPMELEESASIDGAGYFTIFFRIVLPLLTPITATIIILDVLWLWNDFLLPLIILVKKVVTIQLAQYYTRGAYQRDFGMELASLVLAASPIVIFYLFMQKYIIKGITAGAVKG